MIGKCVLRGCFLIIKSEQTRAIDRLRSYIDLRDDRSYRPAARGRIDEEKAVVWLLLVATRVFVNKRKSEDAEEAAEELDSSKKRSKVEEGGERV